MKKIIFLLCLCVVSAPSFASEPQHEEQQPTLQEQTDSLKTDSMQANGLDFVRIRLNAEQDSIYLPLVERFEMRDLSLTLDELALLYYGFTFRHNNMYESSPVKKLIQKKKYQEAWDQGRAYLNEHPVSLTTLEGLVDTGNKLGLPEEEIKPYISRAAQLLHVINYSGDGKSPETAFYVISVSDEYIFMRLILSLPWRESQALIFSDYGPVDKMIMIDRNDVVSDPIYFNVSLFFGKHLGDK